MSIRDYILESKDNNTNHFRVNGIDVVEVDTLPPTIELSQLMHKIKEALPAHFFQGLDKLAIQHLEEFNERHITAVYKDNSIYITNQQKNVKDLVDDIIHEFAHHVETLLTEEIYGSRAIAREFKKKRHQLRFELESEGYWTKDYNFDDIDYDPDFDNFLYKRVGRNMLAMATAGIFIRPYAAISLREYFVTGFEAYYMGKKDQLDKISPVLYDTIDKIHHLVE